MFHGFIFLHSKTKTQKYIKQNKIVTFFSGFTLLLLWFSFSSSGFCFVASWVLFFLFLRTYLVVSFVLFYHSYGFILIVFPIAWYYFSWFTSLCLRFYIIMSQDLLSRIAKVLLSVEISRPKYTMFFILTMVNDGVQVLSS